MGKYGYVRVSTVQQNIGRQLQTMLDNGVDIGNLNPLTADNEVFNCIRSGNTFIDKVSGKDTNRPQFKEMMQTLEKDDEIVFAELSRMGRSLKDIINTTETLLNRGVKIKFVKENIDPSTSIGRAMLGVMGVIAQLERDLNHERTMEGVAIAKQQGRYKGKPTLNVDTEILNMIMEKYINKQITLKKAAECVQYTKASGEIRVGVSIPTFYKLVEKWCIENNVRKVNYIQNVDGEDTEDGE